MLEVVGCLWRTSNCKTRQSHTAQQTPLTGGDEIKHVSHCALETHIFCGVDQLKSWGYNRHLSSYSHGIFLMAENEEDYLRQCFERNVCPVCQQLITKKFGSGQFKDGVFCSLDCYAEWNKALLIRQHQDKVQKSKPDE
ncbi:MAG: hypothetical protein ACYCZH_07695 [Sulfuriferula sp.]